MGRRKAAMFGLLVMLLAVYETWGIAISHWDLEGANKTCNGRDSCEFIDKDKRILINDWQERNCMCDLLCSMYGDCCTDSHHFQISEARRGSVSFECVNLKKAGEFYMRTTCPPNWDDARVRMACEGDTNDDVVDPMVSSPATSKETKITYRNMYCALCHKETKLDLWQPKIECPSITNTTAVEAGLPHILDYDELTKSWGVKFEGKFHQCTLHPSLPPSSADAARRCRSTIKTCAVNWTNNDVRVRCEAYTSLIYAGATAYRNTHCAICNNVPVQELRCCSTSRVALVFRMFHPSLANLFDLTGSSGVVGKDKPCPDDQLYDPFFKKCRNILDEIQKSNYKHDQHNPDSYLEETNLLEYISLEKNGTNGSNLETCPKFLLDKGDYLYENGTVRVPLYKKSFLPGEFIIRDDGALEICVGDLGVKLIDKFGIYMGYVTYAGLGVSIIFLILHLVAVALVSELRNLSGKNLASLCVALLLAYISFMASQLLEETPCFVDAIITYYTFMASFFWMLTMSFDVWRTLRLATSELRVSAGKQWRKFFIYSIWSWLAPSVIVGGAVFVDTSPPDAFSPEWRPDFGVNSCWFGRQRALWLFFAAPFAVIMILNFIFFACSAHMIYSTTSTTRFTASASTQRDFRLYFRLAVVMGLTWITGLIAGTLDLVAFWYVFILLNTLQGLFIFLAFTCTDKVIRALAHRKTDGKPLRPPSFSWSSSGSTRKSHMESEPTHTTDTLY